MKKYLISGSSREAGFAALETCPGPKSPMTDEQFGTDAEKIYKFLYSHVPMATVGKLTEKLVCERMSVKDIYKLAERIKNERGIRA